MTTLSLFNRNLDNFNNEYKSPFFNSVWFKDLDKGTTPAGESISSQMKYNEKSSAWELTLEAAGVMKDKLKVDVKEGHLSVSGEKTKGISCGLFERYIKIPEGVDIEKIDAQFEDGILLVTLPLEEIKATKTIQIK